MRRNITFILHTLRQRNCRLFLIGQTISVIGTWMTATAISWLVYRLTHSAFLLGMVGFAGQFPAFVLAPFAGIYVDRWDHRRTLLVTQTLLMIHSVLLAILTLSGKIDIFAILLLSAFGGFINAFDIPCRQAFVVQLIEKKEDLSNIIGLNSSVFHGARLIGPSIAGIIIAEANRTAHGSGEGWCFLIDALSFIAVLVALWAIHIKVHSKRARSDVSAMEQLREGWTYTFGSMPIRSIIVLVGFISLVGFPHTVLIPIFAGKILHGGPHTLGFLMGASGCGAFLGALWLASRKTVTNLSSLIPSTTALFGVGLVFFSLSRNVWLSCLLLLIVGMGFMIQMGLSNTILQTLVDDDKRGRVMSLFLMAFLGAAPFGSLLAGSLADHIGAPPTVMIGGLCSIAGALWFMRKLPKLDKAMIPVFVPQTIQDS